MPPYRAAIIGTGAITESHLKAVQTLADRVQLVAAMNPDESLVRPFADQNHLIAYTDLAQMLAEQQPNLVINCAPPYVHAAQSIACLEAGAWVFCEKPLCASLAEFDTISAAEDRTGNYLSTVFQWRFGAAGQHYQRVIASGILGDPLVITCNVLWYRAPAYYDVPWRGKWSTEIGGTTMAHGIHLMDLLLWLVGDWKTVQAQVATLDRNIETDTVSMSIVRLESGALASITSSAVSPRQTSHLRLDFQRATLEVESLYYYGNADWQLTPVDPDAAFPPIPDDYPSSHEVQLKQILDSMDANQRPPVSGSDGRRVLEFTTSLYKSAFTGQIVQRGTITPDDPFYHSISGQAP